MTLRSAEFDDIYFSVQDGLAETQHVFLGGNNLPQAWEHRSRFVIAETGFGTGLNFLTAWTLFAATAKADQKLHYISFEQYPLTPAQMNAALARWAGHFGERLPRLLAAYPLRIPGFHRVVLDAQVTLTLIFDDVNRALPELDVPGGVDAWFLDGFAPKKNPLMWTPLLYHNMARLSHAQTTLASFTAVGDVRRGLSAAGFAVQRKKGYGYKWHMVRGVFAAGKTRAAETVTPSRVAIIGGGLAGCAAAFILRRHGIAATIFEQGPALAAGASGNAQGLYNPRLSAHRTPQSDYYSGSWAAARQLFPNLPDIGWRPCGSLHLATDADRARKLQGAAARWGWPEHHMQWLDPSAAADRAGIVLTHAALWLPDAGVIAPDRLCGALAADAATRFGTLIGRPAADGKGWRIGEEYFDAVILAGGSALAKFPMSLREGSVRAVRGQLTKIAVTPTTAALRANLCYGGYLAPAADGVHWVGATFQPWRDDPRPDTADDAENIAKLEAVLPLGGVPAVLGNRANFRAASRDRFPIVGAMPAYAPLYISAAHGSHGIVSSLGAAQLLGDFLTDGPRSFGRGVSAALAPARFAA